MEIPKFEKIKTQGRKVWRGEVNNTYLYIMRYGKSGKKFTWYWIWERPLGYTKLEGRGSNLEDCVEKVWQEVKNFYGEPDVPDPVDTMEVERGLHTP